MKHLFRFFGFAIVFSTTSLVFATQTAELDATEQWRTASSDEMKDLRYDSNGLVITAGNKAAQASFTSPVIETTFPFTALGAHWKANVPGDSQFELSISTSIDGFNFGPFRPIAPDQHLEPTANMPEGHPNPRYGETLGQLYLHPRSDGRFFRYRVILKRDTVSGAGPVVARLGFTVINSGEIKNRPMNSAPLRVGGNDYQKPPVVGRGAWGARPATCNYAYCSTTHIGIHHTASVSDYSCSGSSQCAAVIRAIQTFHMDGNGWCDLGYNYLATPDGTLWEGRGGGDDVRGAHDGHNCGSMGVANVGYFHPPYNHLWTNAQKDAVAELSAWKSSAQNIDPFGTDFYVGLGSPNDNIYGHRDVSATACPGNNVYNLLPDLRSLVSSKLDDDPIDPQFVYDTNAVNVLSGNWTTGTSSPDKYGSNYLWANTGGNDKCGWNMDFFDAPGFYEVFLWWPQGSNRTTQAEAFIERPRYERQYIVNQRINGGQWNSIGRFLFWGGDITIGFSNNAPSGDVVMCDAMRLERINGAPAVALD